MEYNPAHTYSNEKPKNVGGSDKTHLEPDCISGCKKNGRREPILYSFIPDKSLCHKKTINRNIKHQRKVIEPNISNKLILFEDDKCRKVDFNGETIIFFCN